MGVVQTLEAAAEQVVTEQELGCLLPQEPTTQLLLEAVEQQTHQDQTLFFHQLHRLAAAMEGITPRLQAVMVVQAVGEEVPAQQVGREIHQHLRHLQIQMLLKVILEAQQAGLPYQVAVVAELTPQQERAAMVQLLLLQLVLVAMVVQAHLHPFLVHP